MLGGQLATYLASAVQCWVVSLQVIWPVLYSAVQFLAGQLASYLSSAVQCWGGHLASYLSSAVECWVVS